MRRWVTAAAGVLAVGLGGCVSYHQEVPALRMARPSGGDSVLADGAAPNPAYPSVGGDILKGISAHTEAAAYDATVGERAPPPPGPGNP